MPDPGVQLRQFPHAVSFRTLNGGCSCNGLTTYALINFLATRARPSAGSGATALRNREAWEETVFGFAANLWNILERLRSKRKNERGAKASQILEDHTQWEAKT